MADGSALIEFLLTGLGGQAINKAGELSGVQNYGVPPMGPNWEYHNSRGFGQRAMDIDVNQIKDYRRSMDASMRADGYAGQPDYQFERANLPWMKEELRYDKPGNLQDIMLESTSDYPFNSGANQGLRDPFQPMPGMNLKAKPKPSKSIMRSKNRNEE